MKHQYHIFSNEIDEFVKDFKTAVSLYKEFIKDFGCARLYVEYLDEFGEVSDEYLLRSFGAL